jgi:hypothetical protein
MLQSEISVQFGCCLSQNTDSGGFYDGALGQREYGTCQEPSSSRWRLPMQSLRLASPFAEEFLGFLHQSAFAKVSITFVRFAKAILENLNFIAYVYEWICVYLVFQNVLPLTRILLFAACLNLEKQKGGWGWGILADMCGFLLCDFLVCPASAHRHETSYADGFDQASGDRTVRERSLR